MGMLIEGKWSVQVVNPKSKDGEFVRQEQSFRSVIEKDGKYEPEAGRYHLYVSLACPWAHRTLIFRSLKELKDIVSVSVVSPYMSDEGWTFKNDFEGVVADDINNTEFLRELYVKADPNFTGRVTVPILWDKKTNSIVNNESSEIIRIFNSAFNDITGNTQDFYPEELRFGIDEINDYIYNNINNGVYKAGFATTSIAYEKNVNNLFEALDKVEKRIDGLEYLVGNTLTEADWRLFTTLIRFDAVYVGHFKCNIKRIKDYKNLSQYVKRLYQHSGVKDTVNIGHIKTHYYASHLSINPTGIVPVGPDELF